MNKSLVQSDRLKDTIPCFTLFLYFSMTVSCCSLPKDAKGVSTWVLRSAFGLALVFIGVKHLMTVDSFAGFVAQDLGILSPLGELWAYIYAILLVVGGVLFVLDIHREKAAWAAGIALGSIVVGMLLKPLLGGVELGSVMPAVHNTWIWLLVYGYVVCCNNK